MSGRLYPHLQLVKVGEGPLPPGWSPFDDAAPADGEDLTEPCDVCGRAVRPGEARIVGGLLLCPGCGVEGRLAELGIATCRACGCSDLAGCEEGCWWVEADLCSACAQPGQGARL